MNYIEECLRECVLCPHKCKVNRLEGKIGRCKAGSKAKIALANLHYYEEPCISGKNGSGTVFFTGCNMNCKFCQNYKISQERNGEEIDVEELAKTFIELQEKNANNINLVTGVMYIPHIIEAIKIARKNGMILPIVYNSSGYEDVNSLKLLEGYVDVYLPDFKYYFNELGKELSGINNYSEIAKDAIKEMYRQVGNPVFNEDGMIQKGLIIRHLVLPNHIYNSKKVLEWIKKNINKEILVSVMMQYFPTNKAFEIEDLSRKLTEEEYLEIKNFVENLGLNGFIQELENDEEKYVPEFIINKKNV